MLDLNDGPLAEPGAVQIMHKGIGMATLKKEREKNREEKNKQKTNEMKKEKE